MISYRPSFVWATHTLNLLWGLRAKYAKGCPGSGCVRLRESVTWGRWWVISSQFWKSKITKTLVLPAPRLWADPITRTGSLVCVQPTHCTWEFMVVDQGFEGLSIEVHWVVICHLQLQHCRQLVLWLSNQSRWEAHTHLATLTCLTICIICYLV